MTYTEQELKLIREVKIHSILGLVNNGHRIGIACPIHNGRNPNFNIYPDNSYFCFKCGASGNGAIDFVLALGYDFPDACQELIKYI